MLVPCSTLCTLGTQSIYSSLTGCGAMTTNIIKENKGNTRSEKGLYLAAHGHVRKIVPSTTSAQLYKVRSETDRDILYSVIQKSTGEVSCDCEDYMRRGVTCKHMYAVAFTI